MEQLLIRGVLPYRVIPSEGEPVWDEINVMLVGPLEVNAEEDLRLQLWDSGKLFPFLVYLCWSSEARCPNSSETPAV